MNAIKKELPNALIRAFERHFIYDRNRNTHLRNIPFFIENVINNLYPKYKAVYILKRLTGLLLGYVYQITLNEYVIIIPCSNTEKHEILFLLKDSLRELILANYSFKVIFSDAYASIDIINIDISQTF
jgi:hypothetical protein